jgi:hypothetical protein
MDVMALRPSAVSRMVRSCHDDRTSSVRHRLLAKSALSYCQSPAGSRDWLHDKKRGHQSCHPPRNDAA